MSKKQSKAKLIQTVCRECGIQCSVLAQVVNGRVVEITADPAAPKSIGKLCWKVEASLERLYHPDRIQYPLQRTGERGEGNWRRISWEQALSLIAEKLNGFKDTHGAESVAFVKGYYDRRCDLVSRLGNAFGTPNIASIDNTCYIPSASGRLMTYGFDGRPDLGGSPECILSWGSGVRAPLKKGSTLIVVNSLKTEAAKQADIWLQPRPATDLALILGFLNVIINEKLYDKKFVDQWTTGFDKLEQHIQEYPPARVEEITWVPAKKLIEAARLFTSYHYACLQTGNASEDSYNSTQFARAASIIQSICGLLDIPGGTLQSRGYPLDKEGSAADVLRDVMPIEQFEKKLGNSAGHFPVDPLWDTIVNKPAELQPQYLVSSILEKTPYQIQAALVIGSNPVMTWCNAKRVYQAFKQIPFLVVSELIMTPTAALADIVLPSATYLESDAIVVGNLDHGDTLLRAQQKTTQIGECKSGLETVIDLANALGLGHHFWPDEKTYLDNNLSSEGISFDELCRCGRVVTSGVQYRKYLQHGFNTPSGKVELVSSLCEKWGYDPLPVYREPKETPVSAMELSEQYPLILTSFHGDVFVHSQDRYLTTLRQRDPNPLLIIHPNTAAELGIKEGDPVFIENKRGRIKQIATLSEDVHPKVVSVAYGWWYPELGIQAGFGWDQANINILTDDSPPYSPEIGSPAMRGFLCSVYRAG